MLPWMPKAFHPQFLVPSSPNSDQHLRLKTYCPVIDEAFCQTLPVRKKPLVPRVSVCNTGKGYTNAQCILYFKTGYVLLLSPQPFNSLDHKESENPVFYDLTLLSEKIDIGKYLSNRPHFLWVYQSDKVGRILGKHKQS